MSLAVTFRGAARAEFLEAAARYEAQRSNLGAEFIAEIEPGVALVAKQPEAYAVVYKNTAVSQRVASHSASTSEPTAGVSSFSRSSMAAENQQFGRAGPLQPTRLPSAVSTDSQRRSLTAGSSAQCAVVRRAVLGIPAQSTNLSRSISGLEGHQTGTAGL